MLIFEKTDEHTSLGMNGSVGDIISDLIFCIGAVHDGVKQRSPKAAKELRKSVEMFCSHGTIANRGLFEHFSGDEWLQRETEKKQKENEEMLDELEDAVRKCLEQLEPMKDGEDDG